MSTGKVNQRLLSSSKDSDHVMMVEAEVEALLPILPSLFSRQRPAEEDKRRVADRPMNMTKSLTRVALFFGIFCIFTAFYVACRIVELSFMSSMRTQDNESREETKEQRLMDDRQSREETQQGRMDDHASTVAMTCPTRATEIKNFVESFEKYDEGTSKIANNIESFLEHYRDITFDAWGRTYKEVLEGERHWKSTRFPPNIKSGDTIYESACGIGLNLVMTLEILKERGITDVHIYGNEYLQSSVDVANTILDSLAPSFGGHKGKICQGDSANLTQVPANAFDLVYTGYLSLLLDPLEFNMGEKENRERNRALCKSTKDDWRSQKLLDIAEEKQGEWQSQWVKEQIRIAKPGAAVIFEQVSHKSCDARQNFRGISPEWWRAGIEKYGWEVEQESLDFEDDEIFVNHDSDRRYHVFMRKKGGQ